MSGSLITAKGYLRRGASLKEAARLAGFDIAADLDLALWENMPPERTPEHPLGRAVERLKELGAPPEITTALLEVGSRFIQQCREAGLTLREAGDAAWFQRRKRIPSSEAINVVLASRRPVPAGAAQ